MTNARRLFSRVSIGFSEARCIMNDGLFAMMYFDDNNPMYQKEKNFQGTTAEEKKNNRLKAISEHTKNGGPSFMERYTERRELRKLSRENREIFHNKCLNTGDFPPKDRAEFLAGLVKSSQS